MNKERNSIASVSVCKCTYVCEATQNRKTDNADDGDDKNKSEIEAHHETFIVYSTIVHNTAQHK